MLNDGQESFISLSRSQPEDLTFVWFSVLQSEHLNFASLTARYKREWHCLTLLWLSDFIFLFLQQISISIITKAAGATQIQLQSKAAGKGSREMNSSKAPKLVEAQALTIEWKNAISVSGTTLCNEREIERKYLQRHIEFHCNLDVSLRSCVLTSFFIVNANL